jgi:hypothetical protein
MKRKSFDRIASLLGFGLAILLLVAASLMNWGYTFANSQVTDQLTAQKIFFPAAGSPAFSPEKFPDIQKYAGMQLTTGKQAKAYADKYIAVHLQGIAGGKTYSQVSELSRANPTDPALAGQVQTLFRGETIRGMLGFAFAFWQIGQIAMYGTYACFIGGILFLILSIMGFIHLRRTPEDATV